MIPREYKEDGERITPEQPQTTTSSEPVVIQAVSGRPGQPTAVVVEQNGVISAGAATDFGPSVQAQADQYVQSHINEQPADSQAVIAASQQAPVFNSSAPRVKVDIPQGGDFAATRNELLKYPNGTRVQLGESSNEDVYVYNGGLVNSRGEYYTGYGGVTKSMADEARSKPVDVDNVPYSKSFKKEFANLTGAGSSIRDQPEYQSQPGEVIPRDPKKDDTVYINGVPLSPGMSKLTRITSDANQWISKETDNFALGLGPAGSSRNEIGTFLGWAAGAPFGLAQAGADLYALYEVSKTSPDAAAMQIDKNLKENIPAFQTSAEEHPGAFWTTMALGAYMGLKGPLSSSRGYNIAADTVIKKNVGAASKDTISVEPKIKYGSRASDNVIKENIGSSGSSDIKYGARFTGEKPNTKFDTSYVEIENSKTTAGGRARAAAYDSGKKIDNVFEIPSNAEKYADLVNEGAGGEAIPVDPWKSVADKNMGNIKVEPLDAPNIKTITVNKNIKYTPSDTPVFKPFKDTDMNWSRAQENISISIGKSKKSFGFKDNMKEFFGNDKGSAQMLEPLERLRTKTRTRAVDDMTYNPATKRTSTSLSKTRLTFPAGGLLIGGGMTAGSMSSMINGPKARQKAKPYQIVDPFPGQSLPAPGITNLISGTTQKTKPYTGTGGYQPPKNKTGTSTGLAFALGAGVAGGLTVGKMLSPARLRGMGGDGGNYRKLLGSGMKREKYVTGDVTGLIYGKKKRKTKRR